MVRIGTLPMRLLAKKYGADLVYSEELIDHKLLNCERHVNDTINCIDYRLPNGQVVFRTCSAEKDSVILQLTHSELWPWPKRCMRMSLG